MKRVCLLLVILFFGINFVSSTITCDSIEQINGIVGEPISPITINCINDNNETVTIGKTGDFFTLSNNEVSMETTPITLEFFSFSNPGTYYSVLYFSDDTTPISVVMVVEDEEETMGCRLIELPHTTNYRIKQGETGSSSQLKIKVSTECKNSLSMSVTEQTQMNKPMYLQGSSGDVSPGEEFSFTIGLDAEGVNTGTYQNTYIVSATDGDKIYKKEITLFTIVTVSDSPVEEDTFSDLPTCSLDSEMSINNTYSLVCQNDNPNIEIEVPYNEYFQGVSVSESEGTFTYKLKPTKIGIMNLVALFTYNGNSIGEPFSKEVKILKSSSSGSGIEMDILFYQFDNKKEKSELVAGDVTILVKDKTSQSIIPSFTTYLNGNLVNNTFTIKANINYELIVDSENYLSKTLNFTVGKNKLSLILEPNKEFYFPGEVINFSSNEENVNFVVGDVLLTDNSYTFNSDGIFLVKAYKDGFETVEKNLTVKKEIYPITKTPEFLTDWKVGEKIIWDLNENTTWTVSLAEKIDETFGEVIVITSGTGERINFKIEKEGKYTIEAGDFTLVSNYLVEKEGFTIKFWKWGWYQVILYLIILIFIWFFFLRESEEETTQKLSE